MNISTSKWGFSLTTSCKGKSPESALLRGGARALTMRSRFRVSVQVLTLLSESPYSCGWDVGDDLQHGGGGGGGKALSGLTLAMALKMSLKKMREEPLAILTMLNSASQAI